MIRYFFKEGAFLKEESDTSKISEKETIWIDMISPTSEEISFIENLYKIKIPTKQERQEIEISSRYWEEEETIEINTFFALNIDQETTNEEISIFLVKDVFISIRTGIYPSFEDFYRKFTRKTSLYKTGIDIFMAIFDIRIDKDADIIEAFSKEISTLRKQVLKIADNKELELLEKISNLEDFNMNIQENLRDKQKILSSIMKSRKFSSAEKEEFGVMLKDITSLIEHTSFNFERLDYLKNIFIGMLSIEQNKVIKIFTIVNVIFLPPTLIASIYGMNFKVLPELAWHYGYIFAIALMVVSSILPIYIFKRKKLI